MKSVTIAGAAVALVLLLPALGRADVGYFFVENKVSGEASVPGFLENKQSQLTNSTGPFSATVAGSSGSAGGSASYSATINANLVADGSVIATAGSFSTVLSNAPAGTTVSASTSTIANFTVTSQQNFILAGSMTNAQATLTGPNSTSTYVFSVNDLGTTNPASVSVLGTLAPGDYYLTIAANQSTLTTDTTTNAAVNGSFNLTLTTAAIPEPSSLCLAGLAAFGLAGYGGWRRKRNAIDPVPL